jgi:transcriptional regulator with XRE-family HTH domain
MRLNANNRGCEETMKNPMTDWNSTFGERIAWLRKSKKESLQDVVDAIGITKSHVWDLEKERSRNPSLNLILGYAKHFRIPAAAFIETKETVKFRK